MKRLLGLPVPRFLSLTHALLAAMLAASCVGGDPPGEGALLLYIDKTAVDATDTSLNFKIEAVDVFYDTVPPAPDKNGSCTFAGAYELPSVQETDVAVQLTTTGLFALGGFQTRPGAISEVRLLILDPTVERSGVLTELTTLDRCKEDPWGQRMNDPGATAVGDQHGRPRGVLRFIPAAPIEIAADTNISAKVPFDPNVDVVSDGSDLQLVSDYTLTPISANDQTLVPGKVLVDFELGVSDSQVSAVAADVGATVNFRSGRYVQMSLSGDQIAAGEKLLGEPGVRAVIPEFLIRPTATPNDLPSEVWWTASNTIDAQGAWDTQTGSRQVIIAIADTGVDLTHPDLVNNLFINEGELPPAFTAKDSSGHKAADFDGDGVITYHDFNSEVATQKAAAAAFLAAQGVHDTNSNTIFDPVDFLAAGNGVADGTDNDSNGFVDDITGWNFQADTDAAGNPTGGPGNNPQDAWGHGTFVAGFAGAVGNNGVGIPGIAWSVRILPVRIAGPDGIVNGHTPMLSGLSYAQMMGATVINLSFATDIARKTATIPAPTSCTLCGDCKNVFRFAGTDTQFDASSAQFNKEWTDNGITVPVVVAVSDCPLNYDSNKFFVWPASVGATNEITVTSTDESDQISSFAGFGSSLVQLGAPGQDMWGLLVGGGVGALSANKQSPDGTSFAAPLVTGTVALMVSQMPTLAGDASAISSRLSSTADKTGIATSGGRLNVKRAVTSP